MLKRTHTDANSNLLTVEQAANRANLGLSNTRKISDRARATVKIGRTVRIDWAKFYNYLLDEYQKK